MEFVKLFLDSHMSYTAIVITVAIFGLRFFSMYFLYKCNDPSKRQDLLDYTRIIKKQKTKRHSENSPPKNHGELRINKKKTIKTSEMGLEEQNETYDTGKEGNNENQANAS